MNEATTLTKRETKLAKKLNPIVDEVLESLRADGFDIELSSQERKTLIDEIIPVLRAGLTPRFKEIEDRISTLEKSVVATAKKKN